MELIKQNYFFKRRGDVENDPSLQQIIPYIIFSYQNKYFLYKYLPSAGEQRLIDTYQLGIGGHINPIDGNAGKDMIAEGTMREWNEEVDYKGNILEKKIIGILNDDSRSVEKVHLGLVYNFVGDCDDISIKEKDKMQGEMVELKDIAEKIKRVLTDYKTDDFYKDSDKVLLARMLFGEAESCSDIEKIAIAWTALNRMDDEKDWNGTTLQEVILKPYQYSAFNLGRNAKLKNPMTYNRWEFLDCLQLAREILAGMHPDPTNGATHYLNPYHPDLKGKPAPDWVRGMVEIEKIWWNIRHKFYMPKLI